MALDGETELNTLRDKLVAAIRKHASHLRSFTVLADALEKQRDVSPNALFAVIDGYYRDGTFKNLPLELTGLYRQYKKMVGHGPGEGTYRQGTLPGF